MISDSANKTLDLDALHDIIFNELVSLILTQYLILLAFCQTEHNLADDNKTHNLLLKFLRLVIYTETLNYKN